MKFIIMTDKFDGKYAVTDSGNIVKISSGRKLKPYVNWRGKLSVTIEQSGVEIDQLVCTYFNGSARNDQFTEVIHADNDEHNVNPSNLSWGCPYVYYPDEVWRDIPEFEGIYMISNRGRVRSLPRDCNISNTGKRNRRVFHKLVSLHNDGNGYYQVSLSYDAKYRMMYVHRLVAQTFLDNPDNKSEVNHIDGNKQNNNVTNLEWVTRKENIQHAISHGLRQVDYMGRSGADVVSKGCRCVETGKVYPSRLAASKDTGIYDTNICTSINTGRPTKGFHFENI